MSSKLAPLWLGRPVGFRDRTEGRLFAIEVDQEWEVINVMVKRGLLRSETVKLPFSGVSDWSEGHLTFGITSDAAFSRELPPVAAPGLLLSAKLPLSITGAHVSGAVVERESRRVNRLLVRRGGGLAQEHEVPVEHLSFEGGKLQLGVQLESLPVYRSDRGLQSLARVALARHPYLPSAGRQAITVEVSDGSVLLTGNVQTAQARAWAEEAVTSLGAAVTVKNQIVDDISLEVSLGQALSQAGVLRDSDVYPRALLGEVTLFGHASSGRAAEEIESAAARLPGVRSVTARLQLRW